MDLAAGNKPMGAGLGRLQGQMKAWREELLALDRRQKLLYFQHPKVGSLEFLLPGMEELEGWLERGPIHLASNDPAAGTGADATSAGTAPGLSLGRKPRTATVQDKNDAQLQATCRRLLQRSEQDYADRGVWILYVGLGMLNWVDPDDQRPVSSPLKLVPVRLERAGTRFRLRRTGDEALVNSSLALKMSRDLGIEMPVFDDADFTVGELVEQVWEAAAGEPGWSIDSRSILMPFTFHKEAMYRDLISNEAQIMESPLIQAMALGPEAGQAAELSFELADDAALDELVPPETLHSILDADASQRKCIIAAREGRSFVMDGPPGTGKSQTIANIIAELMAVGKTVLFVSEKAAALDVVRDRLTAQKLSPFLLELHSHKATRKQVVETLSRELRLKPTGRSSFDATDRSRLESSRLELSGYAEAVNQVREPLGRSLHAVLGRLLELDVPAHWPVGEQPDFAGLSAAQLGEIQRKGGELSRAWRPAEEGVDFPWRGLAGNGLSAVELRHAAGEAIAVSEASPPLVDQALFLDARLPFLDIPLSRAGVDQRLALMDLIAARPAVPDAWLTGDFSAVEHRVRQWHKNLDARRELTGVIGTSFTQWSAADRAVDLGVLLADGKKITVPGGIANATVEQVLGLRLKIGSAIEALRGVAAEGGALAEMFHTSAAGLSLRRVGVLCELAGMSRVDRRPEADWLDPAMHGSLEESARVLGGAVGAVRELQAGLEGTFTPAVLGLELHALKHRFDTEHTGFFSRWSAAARADRNTLRQATPHGIMNKSVIAALPGAIAWQAAQQHLYAAERTHGPVLKSHYQGLQTNFSKVREAIDLARRATVVAGDDVAVAGLAAQLSASTAPDRLLLPVAASLTARMDGLTALLEGTFGADFTGWARSAALEEALWHMESFAAVLAAPELDRLAAMGAGGLTLSGADAALASIRSLAELDAGNDAGAAADSALLGRHFAGLATDWDALEADLAWCREARDLLSAPLDGAAMAHLGGFSAVGLELRAAAGDWDAAVARLAGFFEPERRAGLAEELGRELPDTDGLGQAMHRHAATDIAAWFEFKRLRDWAGTHGLGAVVSGLEAAGAPAAGVPAALERAALEPWAEAVAAADGRLAEHRSGNRDALVAEFRALDEKLIKFAYSSVVQACTARRPQSLFGAASVIVREAEKKSRHKPIRTLLEQAGGVAQALKPCFMMSPLSVSQYLPGNMRFDVVIFDEASQVMPADAVNCIYRGSQLIVAGDQKQLPPTTFFSAAVDEPDDEDAPDNFDSVLDLCKASGAITSLPLSWHYRSLHEDLITYSNYGFYEGRLNTFPGAVHKSPDLGVHHEYVAGVYQRGSGAKNPIEAERVVDRIIEHRRNNPGLSLGVVTFSTAQADAVFDALEARAADEPVLAGLLENRDRLHGFFVKNLESVQGDERDIIIFSVGYGPDANGRLDMNFGPLTRKGGQRRLNVAITRARRRVEIVSSFRASDMREGASEGNRHLRNYLDFAARGRDALGPAVSAAPSEDGFLLESGVRAAIESLGYETLSHVGSAGYRVDIGVLHPSREGSFLMGVECDGGAYSSAKTARDRDRLRAAVLRNLGWTMERVWGLAWHRDPAGGLARLKDALEAALRADSGGTKAAAEASGAPGVPAVSGAPGVASGLAGPSPADASAGVETGLDFEEVDLFTAPAWAVEYEQARYSRGASTLPPGSPEALPELIGFCETVLAAEAPLHLDLLQARLRSSWGVGSIGSRIKANLLEAVGATSIGGLGARLDSDGFIRIGPPGAVRVRTSGPGGTARRAGAVPPEEFDEAVRLILRDSMGSTEEQLIAALRTVFAWKRNGADIQAAASRAMYRCVRNGICTKDTGGIYRIL